MGNAVMLAEYQRGHKAALHDMRWSAARVRGANTEELRAFHLKFFRNYVREARHYLRLIWKQQIHETSLL